MKVTRAGSQKSSRVPADNFTGTVRLDPVFTAEAPARTKGNLVTFEPGARTNWHSHPLGQTLVITQGRGFVQAWGEAARAVTVGDVVWFPAGEKHWHGAAPDTAMTHFAIGEVIDGKSADWMEPVDDGQYAEATREN